MTHRCDQSLELQINCKRNGCYGQRRWYRMKFQRRLHEPRIGSGSEATLDVAGSLPVGSHRTKEGMRAPREVEVVLRESRNPWISSASPHSRAHTPELLTRGSQANAGIICSGEPTWGMGFTNEKCPSFLRIDFDHQQGSYAWRWGSRQSVRSDAFRRCLSRAHCPTRCAFFASWMFPWPSSSYLVFTASALSKPKLAHPRGRVDPSVQCHGRHRRIGSADSSTLDQGARVFPRTAFGDAKSQMEDTADTSTGDWWDGLRPLCPPFGDGETHSREGVAKRLEQGPRTPHADTKLCQYLQE
jgi:hypothetical protein